MEIEQLEYYLDKEKSFGVNFDYSNDSISWILLSKRRPISRFFTLFSRKDNRCLYDEQLFIQQNPYHLRIASIHKHIYENDLSVDENSYLLNENIHFKSLSDAIEYLKSKNIEVEDLKWSSEIEFV